MRTSKTAELPDRPWRASRWVAMPVIAVLIWIGGSGVFNGGETVAAQRAGALQGMGSVSGTVTASKPFKAAQVYLRNVDKRIQYMVYTNAGAFRAVALFP